MPGHEGGVTGLEIFLMCVFIVGSFLFFISIISLLNIWLQKRKIEFDDFNMYVIRYSSESVIPLKNILEISMTGVWIKEFYRWRGYRITFIDSSSETVYINFWYIRGHGELALFQANVRRQNPSVEIKNWATSPDSFIGLFRKRK